MCFDTSGRRLITASRDSVIKMWNFNNGQILRQMHKGHSMETTDVCFIKMGTNQYIISVGWDRNISIFLESNDEFDCFPVKILDGGGNSVMVGHQDDISSVAFCPPNILASSSIDGVIVIWNLETGYIKSVLREPELALRSPEDVAIEKVPHFLKDCFCIGIGKAPWRFMPSFICTWRWVC
jgi:WD40 repeat protein